MPDPDNENTDEPRTPQQLADVVGKASPTDKLRIGAGLIDQGRDLRDLELGMKVARMGLDELDVALLLRRTSPGVRGGRPKPTEGTDDR